MGPLAGIRVVEIAGIGPGPFCGMMLADMGAEVLAIDRGTVANPDEPLQRSRHRITLDLKSAAGRETLLSLVEHADALFEGNRPGVAERSGYGPDACFDRNPALVYGRMTGWGQTGPLAPRAGHDINYIALSGALQAIGRYGDKPVPPLNLIGDFGGGGMLLAFGMVCALLESRRSGKGQVVDAAMLDGSIALMAMFIGMQQRDMPCDETGAHVLSGAAHFYDTYETSDGKFIAVGALEPQFYATLLEKAGLDRNEFAAAGFTDPAGRDRQTWQRLKPQLAAVFRSRTRAEWCDILEGVDACVAPVMTLSEAPDHPHNRARESFIRVAGKLHNAPAPRFSRSTPAPPALSKTSRSDVAALLERWGVDATHAGSILAAADLL